MDPNNFDFKVPDSPKKDLEPPRDLKGLDRVLRKLQLFCESKFGKDSKITQFFINIEMGGKDDVLDSLSQLKNARSSEDKLNLGLTIGLIVMLLFTWKSGPTLLRDIDQYRNDIEEQKQVIKMERQNTSYLEEIINDRNTLMEKIHKVFTAIPSADEEAEEIIAMLEDIAGNNLMTIDSIGIRAVPETQFYYDDLQGYVQPYEYSFSVEGNWPNLMSFITSMRTSLRLMDLMTLEIEEGQGAFKANFSLYTYHIIEEDTASL